MRDDINCHYHLGPLVIKRFQEWVKNKYGSLEKVNTAWKSDYTSFCQIEPETDQGQEGDNIGTKSPVYNKDDHVFHDCSSAVEDWDRFRTILRMDILRKTNEIIRKTIPGAEIALRAEGDNLLIAGDGGSDNMRWRHVSYAQRRCTIFNDIVKKENVLHFFSDYTTLPYAQQEWLQAMREMVSNGFIPALLPQFDHMRNILLNPHYGRQYKRHYNLDKPQPGNNGTLSVGGLSLVEGCL